MLHHQWQWIQPFQSDFWKADEIPDSGQRISVWWTGRGYDIIILVLQLVEYRIAPVEEPFQGPAHWIVVDWCCIHYHIRFHHLVKDFFKAVFPSTSSLESCIYSMPCMNGIWFPQDYILLPHYRYPWLLLQTHHTMCLNSHRFLVKSLSLQLFYSFSIHSFAFDTLPMNLIPFVKLSSGYVFWRSLTHLSTPEPPDVQNTLIVFPVKSTLSMNVLMIVGAVYHHTGNQ